VANHTALLDGLLLAGSTHRPVHLLAKSEIFLPPFDRFLRAVAQVPLDYDGPDRTALHTARRLLDSGSAVGIFPEAHRGAGDVRHVRHGAAYLQAHTGATVVPVAILGARPAGSGKDAIPRVRSRIDVVFGEPIDISVEGDPARRAVLARSGERLRQQLADHVTQACRRAGQTLPGDLPPTTQTRSAT
jgi:1-acyl-sn-glycerol-3-phosphate acyltransferase